MKNEIRDMLKNIIQENAVDFKESTSNVLYGKIANRLQEQYKTTAKKFFSVNEEKLDENIFQKVKNFVSGEGFRTDEQREKGKAARAKRDAEWNKFVADTPARKIREAEYEKRSAAERAEREQRMARDAARHEDDRKFADEIHTKQMEWWADRHDWEKRQKPTTEIWEI